MPTTASTYDHTLSSNKDSDFGGNIVDTTIECKSATQAATEFMFEEYSMTLMHAIVHL
jgi:hypothetical protein